MAHDPILSTTPLTIKVSRTGGFAGVASSTVTSASPGSAAHEAALALLDAPPPAPARTRGGHPDGFRHELTVASAESTLLRTTYRDPVPDVVAALLAALAAT